MGIPLFGNGCFQGDRQAERRAGGRLSGNLSGGFVALDLGSPFVGDHRPLDACRRSAPCDGRTSAHREKHTPAIALNGQSLFLPRFLRRV